MPKQSFFKGMPPLKRAMLICTIVWPLAVVVLGMGGCMLTYAGADRVPGGYYNIGSGANFRTVSGEQMLASAITASVCSGGCVTFLYVAAMAIMGVAYFAGKK